MSFGGNFRSAARVLFMCQRRQESPFSTLPDDCLYYILHMMRWDWLNDNSGEMRQEQKNLRRLRHQQMIVQAHNAVDDEAEMEDVDSNAQAVNDQDNVAILGVDDDDDDDDDDDANDYMDEDSSDDSEDADSSDDSDEESAASDEYAWGDHVSGRNAFAFNAEDSESDDNNDSDEDEDQIERRRRSAMVRARRSILQFLRDH